MQMERNQPTLSERKGEQEKDKRGENEECMGEKDRSLQGCHAPNFLGNLAHLLD